MSTFYDRALQADRAGDLPGARALLQQAVEAGEAQARVPLAGVLIDGRGGPVDAEAAIAALAPAEHHDPLARRMLATAIALGPQGLAAGAASRFAHARAGDREAAVETGILLIRDNPDAAAHLLLDAARRGSGLGVAALVELARERGETWAELDSQLGRLQASGHPLAPSLASRLKGLPVSPLPPDTSAPDSVNFSFLEDAGASSVREPLHEKPRITANASALSVALCDYVLGMSWPGLKRAEIFNTLTGRTNPDPHRKAYTTSLPRSLQSIPVALMTARMAEATGASALHGEGLAILVYYPGDEYRPHLDCFAADDGWASAELAAQGQRRATALTALNQAYEGGATQFSRLDLAWRGRTGDILTFENVTTDGNPDPMSLHAGSAVTSGWKALASLWVRERIPGANGIAERS